MDGSSSSMTAYVSKQQSCFANLDRSGDCGEVPYPFSWHHKHPDSHHCDQHHHLCQRYRHVSVSGRATLPQKVGGKAARHLDCTLRSLAGCVQSKPRGGGGDWDPWPSDCGCIQRQQEPCQVKLLDLDYLLCLELRSFIVWENLLLNILANLKKYVGGPFVSYPAIQGVALSILTYDLSILTYDDFLFIYFFFSLSSQTNIHIC